MVLAGGNVAASVGKGEGTGLGDEIEQLVCIHSNSNPIAISRMRLNSSVLCPLPLPGGEG